MQQINDEQQYTRAGENKNVPENALTSESEWQRWQTTYGARRRKTFADIVDTLKKRVASLL